MHPLTLWLALAGSVWALFAFAEDHLPAATRDDVAAWLRGQAVNGLGTFGAVWDSVFPALAPSGMRLRRACLASHVTAFLSLCLSGVLYPGMLGVMLLALLLYAPLLLGLLALANVLPGYVSLQVQRLLLHYVSQRQRGGNTGTILLWLLCTSLATGILALLAGTLGFLVVHVSGKAHLLRHPVTWISGYVAFVLQGGQGSLSALQDAAALRPILVPGMVFPSFGIWLYTPCFPLLWGWLYMLAGVLLRRAVAWGLLPVASGAGGLCDIDQRPLHTLGAVAVAVVSAVYWLAIWLRSG